MTQPRKTIKATKTLYRACPMNEAVWTIKKGKVGGCTTSQIVHAPSEAEVISYVGQHEGAVGAYKPIPESELGEAERIAPQPEKKADKLKEYTESLNVAKQFGKSTGYIIEVKIEPQYLRPGSEIESGWLAHVGAPVEEAKYVMRNGEYMQEYKKKAKPPATRRGGLASTTMHISDDEAEQRKKQDKNTNALNL